jgi:hypothetical protein
MTFAPPTLVALASFYVANGGTNLGIVGDASHIGKGVSYHLGRDQLLAGAYSARTVRDLAGLSNAASAIDLGRIDGSLAKLQDFSKWLVAAARANDPGTVDMREIIYSPDGATVLRWDRERGYASLPRTGEADNSHLIHTHISYYRDSEFRDKVAVFAVYFGGLMQITAQVRQQWTPTINASGSSNGVLRGLPDRGAPILERIPVDGAIVTLAEIRTIDGPNGNWRLVEWPDRIVLYALRADWIAGPILMEPVNDSAYKEGHNDALAGVKTYAEGAIIP